MITRLSDIIDTDSQAEILAFFMTATPRSFSVLELSRRLNMSAQSVQTQASNLEKQNILKTFSKNRINFYILNQRHALIPQIKESVKRENKQWPDELSSSLKKLGNLSGIFLSGMFVGRPELVVDLLLVGYVNQAQLTKFLKTTSKQFGGELNYSIMSADEFVMRRDTFDRFIKDIFDYPHIVLLDKSSARAKPKVEPKPAPKSAPKVVAEPKVKAKQKPKTKSKPKQKVEVKKAVKKTTPKVILISLQKKQIKKSVPKKQVKKIPTKKPITKKRSIKKPVTKRAKKRL